MKGLAFVITGVLESLEREEAADLIREHGGKVTTSLSKKTSYMVVGLEAGLKKLATADELKVKQLSEDELLDLIRSKSGLAKEEEKIKSPKKEPKITTKKEPDVADICSPVKDLKLTPKKETKSSPILLPKKEVTTPRQSPRKHDIKVEKLVPKKEPTTPRKSPRKPNVKLEKPSTPPPNIKNEPKSIKKNGAGTGLWQSQDIVTNRKETTHENNIASIENKAWVDKYKPTSVKEIIGQQGPASNVAK